MEIGICYERRRTGRIEATFIVDEPTKTGPLPLDLPLVGDYDGYEDNRRIKQNVRFYEADDLSIFLINWRLKMKSTKLFNRFLLVVSFLLAGNFNAYSYDLFGNDIAGFDVKTPDDCAKLCNADSNCLAWTFVRAGLQGASARCYLKNPVPTPSWTGVCQTNFDCVSGYKQANWCGDKSQGDVLNCLTPGTSCNPRTSKSCSGWWIFRTCTTLQTTDYFCQ
jgi:hypothetical protein